MLQDFHSHVIDIVFNKMKHTLYKHIRASKGGLDIKFFGALMVQPGVAQLSLHIFTVEEMTEYDLVHD